MQYLATGRLTCAARSVQMQKGTSLEPTLAEDKTLQGLESTTNPFARTHNITRAIDVIFGKNFFGVR